MSKPLYVAVVLDDESRVKLLEWWEAETGRPLLTKLFAHHMTVKFKPSTDDLREMNLDTPATLKVVGWAASDSVQAVAVTGHPSANTVPHVTVATDGSPPKLSNDLLSLGYAEVEGLELTGTLVGVYPGK